MKFDLPKENSSIIKVIGVGGGGSNAVNHMYKQGINGVDFLICNTDQQALDVSPVPLKIALGASLTEGRGAGSIPEVGKNAAIENIDELKDILSKNTKMVFVTAGMGGGTGSGAAPVIAEIAREMGILTVGIVTYPFDFEGKKRKLQAEEGIEALRDNVDTLLVINNEKLREMYGNLGFSEAFAQADDVLTTASKGIAEIITRTGYINVDFEDVRTVMAQSGVAIMGSASAEGDDRAIKAIEHAMSSPLLNDNHIKGARYVLLNITFGSKEILMDEISDITDYIQDEAGSTADIIWGCGMDEAVGEGLCVTLIATGFNSSPDTGYDREKRGETRRIQLEDDVPTTLTEPVEPQKNTETTDEKDLKESEEFDPFMKPTSEEKPQQTIEFDINREKEDNASNKSDTGFREEASTPSRSNEVKNELEPYKKTPDAADKSSHAEQENKLSSEEQQKTANERIMKLKELNMKLRTPSGISDLESEPAYKRRKINLDDAPHSSESQLSKFTLTEEEDEEKEKKTQIKPNNPFLHDRPD